MLSMNPVRAAPGPAEFETRHLPLITHAALSDPVAWTHDGPIRAAQYLAEVHALAARLPAVRHVLNLCRDRYRFMVTFGAALLNGQTSVLPPNHAARVLEQVRAACPDHLCVGDGAQPEDARSLSFPGDLRAHGGGFHAVPAIAADHVAALVFTSGSTGEPRPNPKAWGRLVAGAQSGARALGLDDERRYSFVGTVPPQHMYGLEATVMLPMQTGGVVHAGRPLFARDVAGTLAQMPEPRVLVTTPIHIRACVEDNAALPALHRVVSAAAPLARELAQMCEQRHGAQLREIYGCTEAGMLAWRHPSTDDVWQLMHGVTLMRDGDQWFAEGEHLNGRVPLSDVIEVVGPREFRLGGRAEDMINIAGKRASLGDLNRKLNEIPGVRDGVFHLPDSGRRVERLMAFVVAPGRSEAELLEALRLAVDPAFLPRPLVKVDALPRTESGKLPLDRIRELEAVWRAS